MISCPITIYHHCCNFCPECYYTVNDLEALRRYFYKRKKKKKPPTANIKKESFSTHICYLPYYCSLLHLMQSSTDWWEFNRQLHSFTFWYSVFLNCEWGIFIHLSFGVLLWFLQLLIFPVKSVCTLFLAHVAVWFEDSHEWFL